ncbi:flagellar export chaperone FlgN [Tepidibacter mesophilus]|uniref:flagellar export chaperone FlgN n=1 Tax=Tepidibacter mesophilus TaxID=655607 RepID=UPI000C0773EC|nr:flagellar export chaperone FlgN [Tepidibacter mesophilus]
MNIKDLINSLIQISEMKYNSMKEIQEITKMQKIDIENSNSDSLINYIEKKQDKIEDINKLDNQFYSLYIKLKEDLDIDSIENIDVQKYPEIKELKSKIENILKLTKEIDEIDKVNNKKVKEELEKIKENLKNIKNDKKSLSNNMKAYKGYNTKYNHAQGVFIDNKK